MAVKIIRRNGVAVAPKEPDLPLSLTPPGENGFMLLPVLDFSDSPGRTKFLVHRTQEDMWYQVLGFNDQDRMVKLQSSYGTVFSSRVTDGIKFRYLMLLADGPAKQPPKEILSKARQAAPPCENK